MEDEIRSRDVINYANLGPGHKKYFRQLTRILGTLFLIGVIVWGFRRIGPKAHILLIQSRFAALKQSPDMIVVLDGPTNSAASANLPAAQFARTDDKFGSYFVRHPPSCVQEFGALTGLGAPDPDEGLLYAGALSTPDGETRLVLIYTEVMGKGWDGYVQPIGFGTIVPATWTTPATATGGSRSPDNAIDRTAGFNETLEYFAGQRDVGDHSHVIVRYRTDTSEGILDAWLQNDGTVRARFRSGPGAQVDDPNVNGSTRDQ